MRELYNSMLESEELWEFIPDATGVWAKDKKVFERIQQELENDLTDIEIDDSDGI